MTIVRYSISIVSLITLAIFAGCNKEETVSFYSAPKDPPPVQAQVMPVADNQALPPGHPPAGGAVPPPPVATAAPESPLAWTVPAGWTQLPGNQMRFASFQVSDDPKFLLSVIPLGMEAGELVPNVNRWEQQLGLPASPADKINDVVKKVSTNGIDINTVDLTGPESANPRMRMLAAMTNAGGQVWFFKLTGPIDTVGKQKEKFDAFVKSLKPSDGAAPAAPTAGIATNSPPPPAAGNLPSGHPDISNPQQQLPAIPSTGSMALSKYKPADGWKETPGSKAPRMLAFTVNEGDKKADLIVTRFGAHGAGSMLDNVNRWRGQIGLPPVADAKNLPMSDVTAGKENPGILITLDNPGDDKTPAKRMAVAVTSVGPDLWFFKLTGPPETLDKEKANFDAFLKSLEFAPEPPATDEKP